MKHDALETSAAKIEKFFQRRPQSTLYKREETWGKSQLAEACTTCMSLSAKRRKAVMSPVKISQKQLRYAIRLRFLFLDFFSSGWWWMFVQDAGR